MRYTEGKTDFIWKWIEPEQQKAIVDPYRPPFGAPPEPAGENLKRLRPAQYVRKEFSIGNSIARATAHATAHGLYRLWINGQRTDERVLAPELTPFDKVLTYQTYDVTSLLQKGKNAIGALLTDGWHIGRIGLTGDSCQYADKLALLFELEIEYTDGSTERIASDSSFRSSTGPIDFSDIYIGERYDARKEMPGWNLPDFDDNAWQGVHEVESGEALMPQMLAPTLKHEHFEGTLIITPKGERVYDFGQVMAGVTRVTVNGAAGAQLTLDHSETLDKDGNFLRNIAGNNKDQTDYYILAGNGDEVYEQIGSYHGFRFVKITGDAEILRAEAFAIRTANRETASFECSDEKINQLWKNILWSLRGNTISVPTDCPQRERSGFTGDMQIFIRAACWMMDMRNFVSSWLDTVRLEQSEKGEVTIIAPNFPGLERMQRGRENSANTSAGWGDAIVITPWEMYNFYGDKQILKDNYAAMKAWVAFVTRWTETGITYPEADAPLREGHKRYLWDTGFSFGDWLVPSASRGKSNPFAMAEATKGAIGTCYYANSAALLSRVAEVLGETEDANRYAGLAQNIRSAYCKEYYQGNGTLSLEMQGLYVTALAFDMLPESERPAAAEHLVKLIEENDGCLDTGFLSVSHLMDALCKHGQRETALKLLFQTKCPSWLYEVDCGATTIWESWSAITPEGTVTTSSLNHYAFGCVADWMMRELAGIREAAPGFARCEISPDFSCGLTSVRASYDSIKGTISSEWKLDGDTATLTVTIPDGIEAFLKLTGNEQALGAGITTVEIKL